MLWSMIREIGDADTPDHTVLAYDARAGSLGVCSGELDRADCSLFRAGLRPGNPEHLRWIAVDYRIPRQAVEC